jgi:DNA-binding NarL/FixJ family response regulator
MRRLVRYVLTNLYGEDSDDPVRLLNLVVDGTARLAVPWDGRIDLGLIPAGIIGSLSVRETEVLRLYLSGKSVTQIATALSRSVKTISRQKNCAMQKLGASNDRELFDFAARQDLMLPQPSAG